MLQALVDRNSDAPVRRDLRYDVRAKCVPLQPVDPHLGPLEQQVDGAIWGFHQAHSQARGRSIALRDAAENLPEVDATNTGSLAPAMEEVHRRVSSDLDVVNSEYSAVSAGQCFGKQSIVSQQNEAVGTVCEPRNNDKVLVIQAFIVKAHGLPNASPRHLLIPPPAQQATQRLLALLLGFLTEHFPRLEEGPESWLRVRRWRLNTIYCDHRLVEDLEVRGSNRVVHPHATCSYRLHCLVPRHQSSEADPPG
mmetsp:Transcript_143217/g.399255  ORF Transcript_143217/g.399255 Transcript_143217/m.399255 type:complete len:251 (+) Transcript_143217:537-1289(+)